MKYLVFFIFFNILHFSPGLALNPCKSVDLTLNKKWGAVRKNTRNIFSRWRRPVLPGQGWRGVFRQMPLYSQGSTGICYAYAAIEMVDYWRETFGLKITKKMALSSPVYAALLTRKMFTDLKETTLTGGTVGMALKAIKKYGMCRDDIVQKSMKKFTKKHDLDQRKFLEIISKFFLLYPKFEDKLTRFGLEKLWKYMKNIFKNEEGKIDKNIDYGKIYKELVPHITNGTMVSFLGSVLKECQKKTSIYLNSKKIPNFKTVYLRGPSFDIVKKDFSMSLNMKKAQPIAISYCSKMLRDKNYKGTVVHPDKSFGGQKVPKSKDCGPHASVIIGKKKIEGKCNYLIRNTWGSGCDQYDWKCKMNAYGEAVGIWVPEDALFSNLMSYTFFDLK